jgi:gamma-glutamyltranspeptidase/glutathione hydrolase
VLAISVAGGDLQDQVTLNLLLDFIEFGLLPEQAVIESRFATSHHEDSFDPDPDRRRTFGKPGSLTINDSVSAGVCADLSGRGHLLKTTGSNIGAPVMLFIDQAAGIFHAAGDPAAGRHAAGL